MSATSKTPQPPSDGLRERATKLGLHGMVEDWQKIGSESWIESCIEREERVRKTRSQFRRIKSANIGRFKSMADFDWNWPTEIDRDQIEELFSFEFLEQEPGNVILVGPNGVGKTMVGQNLAYQALLRGHTVLVATASKMLNDLAAQEGAASFERRIRKYTRPRLLFIDELGYLSYDSRHADLLFEVVTRRYLEKSTIVSTNRAFKEWHETFPNASCVVTLVDRLIHRSEVVKIVGESYRLKEAQEMATQRAKVRKAKRRPNGTSGGKDGDDARIQQSM